MLENGRGFFYKSGRGPKFFAHALRAILLENPLQQILHPPLIRKACEKYNLKIAFKPGPPSIHCMLTKVKDPLLPREEAGSCGLPDPPASVVRCISRKRRGS